MFGKLVKYEFKAIGNWYLGLNALILLASLIFAPYSAFLERHQDIVKDSNVLFILFIFLSIALVIMIITQSIATLILIIRRFYSNMFGREGYLTLTLPVSRHQLISSKLLVAIALTLGNYIVIALGAGILWLFNQHEVGIIVKSILAELSQSEITNGGLWVLSTFINLVTSTLLIFASIAIGQLFRNHRILMAFVSYFGIEFSLSIIGTLIRTGVGVQNTFENFRTTIVIGMIANIFLAILWYLLTHYITTHKLDIQ
ncbi:hypothetical protein ACVR1G_05210 [Streptococcus dentasini]